MVVRVLPSGCVALLLKPEKNFQCAPPLGSGVSVVSRHGRQGRHRHADVHPVSVGLAPIPQKVGDGSFGKTFRQLDDDVLGHFGDAFRDLGRILVELLPQKGERRAAPYPIDLVLPFEGRIARLVRRDALPRPLVPNDDGVHDRGLSRLGIHRTFARLDAQIAHPQVKAVIVFDKKRRARVLQQKVLVMKSLRIENLHERQSEGRVRAGTDGYPLIGFRSDLGERGIYDDQLRPRIHSIGYEMPGVHGRLCGVVTPAYDRVGVDQIRQTARIVATEHAGLSDRSGHVDRRVDVCSLDVVEKAGHEVRRAAPAVENRRVAESGPEGNRLISVLLADLHEIVRHKLYRIVPAYALPLARSAIPDAFHGIFDPVGIVDARDMAQPAQARPVVMLVLHRCGTRVHHDPVAHRNVDVAGSEAIATAAAFRHMAFAR